MRAISILLARSGMLPGYISGFYSYDDVHVDLAKLAAFARARLVHAEASGIDIKVCRMLLTLRVCAAAINRKCIAQCAKAASQHCHEVHARKQSPYARSVRVMCTGNAGIRASRCAAPAHLQLNTQDIAISQLLRCTATGLTAAG